MCDIILNGTQGCSGADPHGDQGKNVGRYRLAGNKDGGSEKTGICTSVSGRRV